MNKKSEFNFELIFNLILMILSFYIIISSIRIGFGSLKEPDAGFFPFLGGLLILISNIFILIHKSRDSKPIFGNNGGIKILLLIMVTYILWIIVMPYLGYVLVTFMATFGLSKIMKLEGWIKPLILSVAMTLFVYLMFDYLLYLDFPRGILG